MNVKRSLHELSNNVAVFARNNSQYIGSTDGDEGGLEDSKIEEIISEMESINSEKSVIALMSFISYYRGIFNPQKMNSSEFQYFKGMGEHFIVQMYSEVIRNDPEKNVVINDNINKTKEKPNEGDIFIFQLMPYYIKNNMVYDLSEKPLNHVNVFDIMHKTSDDSYYIIGNALGDMKNLFSS